MYTQWKNPPQNHAAKQVCCKACGHWQSFYYTCRNTRCQAQYGAPSAAHLEEINNSWKGEGKGGAKASGKGGWEPRPPTPKTRRGRSIDGADREPETPETWREKAGKRSASTPRETMKEAMNALKATKENEGCSEE